MRRQYLFIILFVVWCAAATWWYLFGVKGVKTEPALFNPQATLISIIEILLMLLVACLLGYAIAWWTRSETIEEQKEDKSRLQSENSQLVQANNELKNQAEMWRDKHAHDLSTSQQKLHELNVEKEKLHRQSTDFESTVASVKQEALSAQTRATQNEAELGTLRYRIRQLEFQNKEQIEASEKLKLEIEILALRKEKTSQSDHPFVRPVEPDEKDDLTKIKGIGPFIEKRLNMIGIYTFGQLAELTPELVDRVGAAIEFFPHRIVRDNWVGQAQGFISK